MDDITVVEFNEKKELFRLDLDERIHKFYKETGFQIRIITTDWGYGTEEVMAFPFSKVSTNIDD